jgi:hypothetical protein
VNHLLLSSLFVSTADTYSAFRLIASTGYADSVVDTARWYLNGIIGGALPPPDISLTIVLHLHDRAIGY